MKIISVNVGVPREVIWKGIAVQTAIFKEPVAGDVAIRELNLAGDQQADLTVHGGSEKAVYAYPAEHYDYWRKQLPDFSLAWGAFGENLTTEGLHEDNVFIGDRLQIGSAILMVTQPRMPCFKLQLRFGREDMIKRLLMSRRSGFYCSVATTGEVSAASKIEILQRDPNHVSVRDVLRLYLGWPRDPELLERVASLTSLPPKWRTRLLLKLSTPSP
jgi:MOSC domain-containing protein YiiM